MDEKHINRTLREFYEFNDDDLEANRQGRLSAKQAEVIESVRNTRRTFGNMIGNFQNKLKMGLLIVVVILLLITLATKRWEITAAPIIVGIFFLISDLGTTGLVKRTLLAQANSTYILRTTRGPVHLTTIDARSGPHSNYYKEHQMQIGEPVFVLDDELVRCIKEGENYAVYYLDYQDGSEGIIQSLEKLDTPQLPRDISSMK